MEAMLGDIRDAWNGGDRALAILMYVVVVLLTVAAIGLAVVVFVGIFKLGVWSTLIGVGAWLLTLLFRRIVREEI